MHDLEGKKADLSHICPPSAVPYSKLLIPKLVPRKVRTVLIVAPPKTQENGLQSIQDENCMQRPQRRQENQEDWDMKMEDCSKMEGDRQEGLGNSFQDLRVNKKTNKKGKRDGQNIRTYARYDSLIQTLEQELAFHRISTKNIDQNLFDHFDMKSKRSLERYFFYLCLAKSEEKLVSIIPQLRIKTKKKVIQKGGHRTTQFLETLQGCIDCYIEAAQMLNNSQNSFEARQAFKHAYLYDENESMRIKRPHHNQVKGIQKCMRIYEEIIQKIGINYFPKKELIKDQGIEDKLEKDCEPFFKIHELHQIKTFDQENPQYPHILTPIKFLQSSQKNQYSSQKKYNDHNVSEVQMSQQNQNEKQIKQGNAEEGQAKHGRKKVTGLKNKKQDDRDIQKYAKFDIISESSLEFCKARKINKLIPQNSRKLSQRSLHFFFVILAFIEKQQLQAQFLDHLQNDHETKVDKRYTQRSPYFREQLKKSFRNLVDSTRLLFCGKLDEALEKAYQVHSQKRTHPAKANQLKKCHQIYRETVQLLRLPSETGVKVKQGGDSQIRQEKH